MNQEQQNIIIYNTTDGKASVKLHARDGMVWMSQGQLAELFDTSKQNIGQHVANILNERELDKNSVVKNYFTTAADGKKYQVVHYSLEMILAVGFRVRSKRGTQFRIWANDNLKEYIVKGFVTDDERLKNPDGRPDYFDELLERIRQSILTHKGEISHAQMEDTVREIYLNFDQKRKAQEAEQADKDDLKDLQELEDDIRRRDTNG